MCAPKVCVLKVCAVNVCVLGLKCSLSDLLRDRQHFSEKDSNIEKESDSEEKDSDSSTPWSACICTTADTATLRSKPLLV